MARRGRSPGYMMSDEHRTKISNSKILNRLIDFVEGRLEMSSAQANAALGLLRKVMPDMQAIEHSGDMAFPFVIRAPEQDKTADEWEEKHSPSIN